MWFRVLATLGGVLVAVALVAAPAGAHVTVNPDEATQGGFVRLAFRVPNESDTASTTKLEVQFPTDHPLAFVSVLPQPAWTYTVTKSPLATPVTSEGGQVTEAVSLITWSGGAIRPGEFDEFVVSVGRLPEGVDSMAFKAVQTYDDGEVARWIEPTPASGEEPEHPAPTLELVAADGAAGAGGTGTEGTGTEAAGAQAAGGAADGSSATSTGGAEASSVSPSDVDGARAVGIVGIVVGALGLALGVLALLRRPRTAPPAS